MFDQVVHKIDLLHINILSARIKQLDTLLCLYWDVFSYFEWRNSY